MRRRWRRTGEKNQGKVVGEKINEAINNASNTPEGSQSVKEEPKNFLLEWNKLVPYTRMLKLKEKEEADRAERLAEEERKKERFKEWQARDLKKLDEAVAEYHRKNRNDKMTKKQEDDLKMESVLKVEEETPQTRKGRQNKKNANLRSYRKKLTFKERQTRDLKQLNEAASKFHRMRIEFEKVEEEEQKIGPVNREATCFIRKLDEEEGRQQNKSTPYWKKGNNITRNFQLNRNYLMNNRNAKAEFRKEMEAKKVPMTYNRPPEDANKEVSTGNENNSNKKCIPYLSPQNPSRRRRNRKQRKNNEKAKNEEIAPPILSPFQNELPSTSRSIATFVYKISVENELKTTDGNIFTKVCDESLSEYNSNKIVYDLERYMNGLKDNPLLSKNEDEVRLQRENEYWAIEKYFNLTDAEIRFYYKNIIDEYNNFHSKTVEESDCSEQAVMTLKELKVILIIRSWLIDNYKKYKLDDPNNPAFLPFVIYLHWELTVKRYSCKVFPGDYSMTVDIFQSRLLSRFSNTGPLWNRPIAIDGTSVVHSYDKTFPPFWEDYKSKAILPAYPLYILTLRLILLGHKTKIILPKYFEELYDSDNLAKTAPLFLFTHLKRLNLIEFVEGNCLKQQIEKIIALESSGTVVFTNRKIDASVKKYKQRVKQSKKVAFDGKMSTNILRLERDVQKRERILPVLFLGSDLVLLQKISNFIGHEQTKKEISFKYSCLRRDQIFCYDDENEDLNTQLRFDEQVNLMLELIKLDEIPPMWNYSISLFLSYAKKVEGAWQKQIDDFIEKYKQILKIERLKL